MSLLLLLLMVMAMLLLLLLLLLLGKSCLPLLGFPLSCNLCGVQDCSSGQSSCFGCLE